MSLVELLIYCRYKCTVTKLVAVHISHCADSEIVFLSSSLNSHHIEMIIRCAVFKDIHEVQFLLHVKEGFMFDSQDPKLNFLHNFNVDTQYQISPKPIQ